MAQQDDFPTLSAAGPIRDAAPIAPADDTMLDRRPRALNVSASGLVMVKMDDENSPAVAVYVVAGIVFPLSPAIIMATGTTATDIVGLF